MKKVFDRHNYTKCYVDEKGEIYSSNTYHGDGTIRPKAKTLNKKRGYWYTRTANRNYSVHRLVAENFIENPENKPCVSHKNGDKSDNCVENLEWTTYKENHDHAIRTGLSQKHGKNQGVIKYTNEQCADVLARIKSGIKYAEAGAKYKMPYSTVAHLARGSRRKI